ncbi:MAG: hypothetical protein RIB98_08425 [Acidimicrobiales bacterium]
MVIDEPPQAPRWLGRALASTARLSFVLFLMASCSEGGDSERLLVRDETDVHLVEIGGDVGRENRVLVGLESMGLVSSADGTWQGFTPLQVDGAVWASGLVDGNDYELIRIVEGRDPVVVHDDSNSFEVEVVNGERALVREFASDGTERCYVADAESSFRVMTATRCGLSGDLGSVFGIDANGSEIMLEVVDLDGQERFEPIELPGEVISRVVVLPGQLLVASADVDGGDASVVAVDPDSGRLLDERGANALVVQVAGTTLNERSAVAHLDNGDGRVEVVAYVDGGVREIGDFGPVRATVAGGRVVAWTRVGGTDQLVEIDPASGNREVLVEDSISGVYIDVESGAFLVLTDDDGGRIVSVGGVGGDVTEVDEFRGDVGGYSVSFARSLGAFLVSASGAGDAPTLAAYGPSGELGLRLDARDWVEASALTAVGDQLVARLREDENDSQILALVDPSTGDVVELDDADTFTSVRRGDGVLTYGVIDRGDAEVRRVGLDNREVSTLLEGAEFFPPQGTDISPFVEPTNLFGLVEPVIDDAEALCGSEGVTPTESPEAVVGESGTVVVCVDASAIRGDRLLRVEGAGDAAMRFLDDGLAIAWIGNGTASGPTVVPVAGGGDTIVLVIDDGDPGDAVSIDVSDASEARLDLGPPSDPTLIAAAGVPGVESRYSGSVTGDYYATVVGIAYRGNEIEVAFQATGNSDLRRPETSCLIGPDGSAIEPEVTDLSTDSPGFFEGSFLFQVGGVGSYDFVYSCSSDYSSARVFAIELQALDSLDVGGGTVYLTEALQVRDVFGVRFVEIGFSGLVVSTCVEHPDGGYLALVAVDTDEAAARSTYELTFAGWQDDIDYRLLLGCDPDLGLSYR